MEGGAGLQGHYPLHITLYITLHFPYTHRNTILALEECMEKNLSKPLHPNLIPLSEEEQAKHKGPTPEQIQNAIERGRKARKAALENAFPARTGSGVRYS